MKCSPRKHATAWVAIYVIFTATLRIIYSWASVLKKLDIPKYQPVGKFCRASRRLKLKNVFSYRYCALK